jgi:tRNA(Ile)-lysidine synthase
MELQAKVLETIRREGLLSKGDRILVACSGGADSTCMLLVLHTLRKEWLWDLAVAHFNHRLRREAAEDEQFSRELAGELGLPFYARAGDVADWARSRGLNLEEAGRQLRYAFLEETAAAIGADRIVTAHTMDDQAETVLMRLLRGSGRSGLTGIPPERGKTVVRPLLQVSRSEVEAYLGAQGRTYRLDRSNQDRRYLRNRIRWELLPYLSTRFDPHIVPRLGRLAEILRAEEEWIETQVESQAAGVVIAVGESWALDCQKLQLLPVALQRRLVRLYLTRLRGDLRHIAYKDIEAILNLEEGREFTLEKGRILRRRGALVELRPEPLPRLFYRLAWDGKAPLALKDLGITLSGEFLLRKDFEHVRQDNRRTALLDAAGLRFPLTVRSRVEGDRYRPLGAPGRSKLKEIFRAKGIAPDLRDRHPVVVSGGRIVWVLGLPVSEESKVRGDTSRVFVIRIK